MWKATVQTRNATKASLAIRAAWLHFVGRLTQAEIAKRLGVSGIKVDRLIARATQEGAVKFVMDGDIAECVALESSLSEQYSLNYCEVVPRVSDDKLPLRVLGVAGAAFLQREVEGGDNDLIGLGHGRTLSAVVNQLPSIAANGVRYVSLLGGLTRNFAFNPPTSCTTWPREKICRWCRSCQHQTRVGRSSMPIWQIESVHV